MEKKNKLIILGVIILLLIASGLTFAILTWNSTMIKLGINTNCFTINYAKGNNISGSLKLINEEDLISNGKFTIKEGVGVSGVNIGINSNCSIEGYGNIILNITNISSAFTTGSSKGALKYAVLKNTSTITTPSDISTTSLLNQSFDIEKKGSIDTSGTLKLLTKQLSNTELYKYIIVIYVDNNLAGNDVTSATFQGNISADATQGRINADITLNYLNKFNNTIKLANDTPDFTTVSGNNGVKMKHDSFIFSQTATGVGDGTKGIYKAEDDFGTSYYFRGAVENNYVKFANFYWRIIRINGDGSIRMIYAGTSAHANGESETDSFIDKTAYNTNYQDNGYVGYMYGNFTTPTNCNTDNNTGVTTCTGGSTSYEEAHANINDSTIKTYIDNWYNDNLKDYAYALEDTIYCNDRSITPVDNFAGVTLTGIGKGIENTAYSGFTRSYINHTPSLKCVNKNDRFTVNNSIGNTKLTNPIALITSDEVYMAGAFTYNYIDDFLIKNTDFYLYNGNLYWTMTPFGTFRKYSRVEEVSSSLSGGYQIVQGVSSNGNRGVRPVVSLSSDAISGGKGTMNDPFIVG